MATSKPTQDLLQAPKGMRDIRDGDFYRMQGFFEKAQEIALYYGFAPIETPIVENIEIFQRGIGDGTDIIDKEMYEIKSKSRDTKLALRPEFTAALMRAYISNGMSSVPQPVKWYHWGPVFRHDKPQRGRYRQFYQFDCDVLGSPKPVLDALCIKLGLLVLEEVGVKDIVIKINSIGDKESQDEYRKILTAYYRKHIGALGTADRQRLKTNPLRILDSKDPKTIEVNAEAPQTLGNLNRSSKEHFKKVIEYLDEMEIPYEIDHTLVRGLDYYTHTVFEFFTVEKDQTEDTQEKPDKEDASDDETHGSQLKAQSPEQKLLALGGGGRYDNLAKSMGYKKDVPAVGVSLGVDRVLEVTNKKLAPRVVKKPKVYFIQLGTEAKMKSMNIIEILRKARVPIEQSLAKDSLGSQLGVAEKLGVPYVMIFGQKEAIDGTVLVRDMASRKQDAVKIEKLADYVKKLK